MLKQLVDQFVHDKWVQGVLLGSTAYYKPLKSFVWISMNILLCLTLAPVLKQLVDQFVHDKWMRGGLWDCLNICEFKVKIICILACACGQAGGLVTPMHAPLCMAHHAPRSTASPLQGAARGDDDWAQDSCASSACAFPYFPSHPHTPPHNSLRAAWHGQARAP